MIANFFKKITNFNVVVLITIFILYYFFAVFLFEEYFFSFSWLAIKFGVFCILLMILFIIQFINSKNELSSSKGYVFCISLFFIILFPNSMLEIPILISSLFSLLALRKIYSLRTNNKIKAKIFDSTFWIAIAMCFYNWSALLIILVYIAIILFKKGTLKNLCIPVFGFITPLFLIFTYFFYVDNVDGFFELFEFQYSIYFQPYNPMNLLIPITFVISLIFWLIFNKNLNISKTNNQFKTSNNLIIINLIIAFFIAFLAVHKSGAEFLFFLLPFSVSASNYLTNTKDKWFSEILISILLLLPVMIYTLEFFSKS